MVHPDLGLPRDLNGDGVIDSLVYDIARNLERIEGGLDEMKERIEQNNEKKDQFLERLKQVESSLET